MSSRTLILYIRILVVVLPPPGREFPMVGELASKTGDLPSRERSFFVCASGTHVLEPNLVISATQISAVMLGLGEVATVNQKKGWGDMDRAPRAAPARGAVRRRNGAPVYHEMG